MDVNEQDKVKGVLGCEGWSAASVEEFGHIYKHVLIPGIKHSSHPGVADLHSLSMICL